MKIHYIVKKNRRFILKKRMMKKTPVITKRYWSKALKIVKIVILIEKIITCSYILKIIVIFSFFKRKNNFALFFTKIYYFKFKSETTSSYVIVSLSTKDLASVCI